MSKLPRWKTISAKDGVWRIQLSSWKYFHDYVRQQMLDYSHYVWRGHRDSSWKLQSSLDRSLKSKLVSDRDLHAAQHLKRFKLSVRGRRGSSPSRIDDENEWWALGQHHSLATPLLDWTESAFVALYFAFEKQEKSSNGSRSVWALGDMRSKNIDIEKSHKSKSRPPIIEYIRPHQDDNARLVNQAGLFTRVPLGITVEEWVSKHSVGEDNYGHLIQLIIPDKDRPECLRTLNRMNINHLTLFPDLYGAGHHCNNALQIEKY